MSLSRPAKFPLLKLPLLCIECVIKSWDIFDIIFFALFSKKTRRIVKHLKIPLNGIRIFLTAQKCIKLDISLREWYFKNESEKNSLFDVHSQYLSKHPLVLQNNEIPLYISKTGYGLESYCDENEFIALKMAMEFLNEVFKCSVKNVWIEDGNFPESGDIGVKSTMTTTEKDFNCDPKLFKCKKLIFFSGSAAWVTWEILVQFEVPRLIFHEFQFSVEDIVSFVTQWFYSDNKKLEYLYIYIQSTQISLEDFQTEELNPVPFSGLHRVPSTEPFRYIDFSKGLEIVRHDGLQATIHVTRSDFLFYIWHNQ